MTWRSAVKTPTDLQQENRSRENGAGLILLFGMPRSGTTWLGKIFDSDPCTLYRHEPDSFGRLNYIPMTARVSEAERYASRVRLFAAGLPALRDTKIVATLPAFPKAYLTRMQYLWNGLAIRYAKLEARMRGEATVHLWLPEQAITGVHVIWKSIECVSRLGIISSALPQARGILIVRNPCGYVASVIRGKQRRRFSDADSVGEDRGLLRLLTQMETAREYGVTLSQLEAADPVERLIWQWVLCNAKAMAETQGPDRQILIVRYEDLCREPILVTQKMFAWIGLDMNGQTERFLRASTGKHERKYDSVYKNPAKAAYGRRPELPRQNQDQIWTFLRQTRIGELFADQA